MANNALDYMKDVLAAPLGELISSIGNGVAEAQAALDAGSLAQTLQIYSDNDDPLAKQLRDIGYQPTFYTLPETTCEAQVSFSLSASQVATQNGTPSLQQSGQRTRVYASPVNASVTNKYNMESSGSAKLTFKVVAVPPQGNIPEIRVVPNLVGKTKEEAETVLSSLGLDYEVAPDIDGNIPTPATTDTILSQSPAPGELIQRSQALSLTFDIAAASSTSGEI